MERQAEASATRQPALTGGEPGLAPSADPPPAAALPMASSDRVTRLATATLIGLVIALAVTTLAMMVLEVPFAVRDVRLDVVLMTFSGLGALAAGAVAWIRFRETGRTRSLFQSAAFLVIFAPCTLFVGVFIAGHEADLQAGFWVCTVSMGVAGMLMVLGIGRHLRHLPAPSVEPHLFAVAPAAAVLAFSLLAVGMPETLPPLVSGALLQDVQAGSWTPVRLDAAVMVLQLPAILSFAGAALGYTVLYRRVARRADATLSAALVFAAASQVHFALVPVYQPGLLSSAELLRSTFLVLVLLAATQVWRFDLRSLRRAYEDQVRGRETEVEQAAMTERARLAREIHDKLVQSLWVARLRSGHLLDLDLEPQARELAETVVRALDDGLAESREAILILSSGPDGPIPLDRLVRQSLDRMGVSLALDIRLTTMGSFQPMDPRVEAELLTILREAVTNTAKHADASLVRVRLASDEDGLLMEVADNGVGFDPTSDGHGMGLRSMRERALSIGGRMTVRSEPQDGTVVLFQLPYAAAKQALP